MKTSLFLSHIDKAVEQGSAKNIDDALKMLVPYGLECVDVNGAVLGSKYTVKDLKSILDCNGVKVSSIFHFGSFDWKDENILSRYRDLTKKQFEYCSYLETDIFMPVPNVSTIHKSESERRECQKVIIGYLNDAAVLSKEYGIKTVMENYSSYNNPYATLEDFDVIFENTSGVDYVLDTGNFWFSDIDVVEAYEKYHSITRHVHLKDITPNNDGFLKINGKNADSNDIGSGIIDFPELFKRLKLYGYDGAVSIEICNQDDIMNKIIRSIKYVESLRR